MFGEFCPLTTVQTVSCRTRAGLLAIGISAFAISAEPPNSTQRFAASEMNAGIAGRLSQVMVLGSVHLGQTR